MTAICSVLIPAYNAEDTLVRALASLQAQSEPAWEAIVIDDGSSDRTLAVASQVIDSRVRVLRMSTHRGVSKARNLGLEHAAGEWIGLLDADDEWLPTRLELLLKVADETSADIVGDDLLLRDATGREL